MEGVGGSILSACIDAVIGRLKSIDWLKYVDGKRLQEQLVKWEKMLDRIYDVLDDADEIQTTSRSVEVWLNDLKHFTYDLEDVLDEIETGFQQHNLEDEDPGKRYHFLDDKSDGVRPSKRPRLISQAWKWISSLPAVSKWNSSFSSATKWRTVKFNVEFVSKIDEISTRLDELLAKKEILNLHKFDTRRRFIQANERPPSTSLVNESKIYGREDDKEAILKLMGASTHNADIVAIPIVGMGGVGKTTLAQLIYNDTELQYDWKAWVCVGEDFDVIRVTKTILQSNDEKDLDSLQVKLKQKLSGKKFLFVLDDVWSENYELWTLFCCPFEAGAPGSRIIITTRSWEVSRMTTGASTTAHYLKELPYDECLSVFCQHALGATNFDQHLDVKAIGEEIVKRCRGLPLAAKALGGLLRGKFNTNAWEEVLKSKIWDLPEYRSNILPALRLSYLYLPPPLKRCFAYCSIFPKDYEFDRNELVLLWMAEGFLCQQNKVKQSDYLGHEYFDELLSRSFFQRSSDNRSRYVMHDLINDLAHFVSRDTCFHLVENELVSGESYADIRHSSFVARKHDISRRFECFYKIKKLRTFLSLQQSNFYSTSYLSRKVFNDLLPKLKCLRALSLTNYDIEELPSCVGELKQLRYLDLSFTNITRLPESVGRLFNLETLKLHDCYGLVELPNSICNLTNLLYLDICWTTSLKEMPVQIGNLTSLRMLSKFLVGEGNVGLKISELKKLSQLEGKLEINGLQNVGDIKDENLIKEKPGLLELYLKWDCYHTVVNSNVQDEQTLKSLEPHQNALSVSVSGFCGRKFPSWVGDPMFSKMVKLELLCCKHIKVLPQLGRLPSLKELRIRGLSEVEEVGSEFYGDDSFFPCLESLEIQEMSEWKHWSWSNSPNEDSVGRFHKLRKLIIRCCPKLVGKLPSFLPSLEHLQVSVCEQLIDFPGELPSLKRLYIGQCQGAVLRNLTNVPCLIELIIERMDNLLTLDESYLPAMGALEKLYISKCNELKCLWVDGTDSDYLTSLKHLDISSCKELVSLVNVEGGLLPLNLEYLNLSHCKRLKEVPNGLNCLKNLDIIECPSLEVLQLTNGFDSLQNLDIRNCFSLKVLQLRNGCLHSLKSLVVADCPSLEVLFDSEMPCLETMDVRGCKYVSCSLNGKFADSLKFLTIGEGAKELLEPSHYGFPHLTNLSIDGCFELESFPERVFPNIPTLVSLSIFRCKRLKSLTNHLQNFHGLQSLSIVECDEFEWLPEKGFPNHSLVSFTIDRCHKLTYLPNQMQNLTSLQCLYLKRTEILSLEGCLPPKLSELEISDCKKLSQPMAEWGLNTLSFLKKLTIRSNADMVSIPDNDRSLLPSSLTYLEISGFKNLESISGGIRKLISLQELHIAHCSKLKSFPVEGFPPALEYLQIYDCPHLKDWCSKDTGEYGPIISYKN